MTLEQLATKVVQAADASGVPFMVVGALAAGAYGVPRSTRDVDLLVAVNVGGGLDAVVKELEPWVEFDAQVVFDTLTWGRRQVGRSRSAPPYKVELFEVFDDPFVQAEFSRRRQVYVPMLKCQTGCPRRKTWWCKSSAGGATKTWMTPATCWRCKGRRRSTCPTSSSGAPNTARASACVPRWQPSRRFEPPEATEKRTRRAAEWGYP